MAPEGIHYACEWLIAKEEGERLPMPKYQDSEFPGESESYDQPKKTRRYYSRPRR